VRYGLQLKEQKGITGGFGDPSTLKEEQIKDLKKEKRF